MTVHNANTPYRLSLMESFMRTSFSSNTGESAGESERTVQREKKRKELSVRAVIRGSQQGGQGGLVGSEQSTTKQPFSSLAASLRGASLAYLSSGLLNRLTSGSHPTHTLSHTLPSLIPTEPEESRPRCSLTDNFNFFFNLT